MPTTTHNSQSTPKAINREYAVEFPLNPPRLQEVLECYVRLPNHAEQVSPTGFNLGLTASADSG